MNAVDFMVFFYLSSGDRVIIRMAEKPARDIISYWKEYRRDPTGKNPANLSMAMSGEPETISSDSWAINIKEILAVVIEPYKPMAHERMAGAMEQMAKHEHEGDEWKDNN